jgi:hypothetical protein
MLFEITWKNDCQGKKDYDAHLVELSSRYYPQGGGFLSVCDGVVEDNEDRPDIKPTAISSIYLGNEVLASEQFKGETEAEVREQVEQWAALQAAKVEAAVRAAFAT